VGSRADIDADFLESWMWAKHPSLLRGASLAFSSALGKPTFIGHLSPASAGLFLCRLAAFTVYGVARLAGLLLAQQA
jgi:hypothetical protein